MELEELLLDGNKLSGLPHTIGDLGRLKKLLLHKNQLRYLPSVSCNGCFEDYIHTLKPVHYGSHNESRFCLEYR